MGEIKDTWRPHDGHYFSTTNSGWHTSRLRKTLLEPFSSHRRQLLHSHKRWTYNLHCFCRVPGPVITYHAVQCASRSRKSRVFAKNSRTCHAITCMMEYLLEILFDQLPIATGFRVEVYLVVVPMYLWSFLCFLVYAVLKLIMPSCSCSRCYYPIPVCQAN